MTLSDVEAYRRRAILIGTAATRAELELTQEGRRFLANQSFRFVDLSSSSISDDPILRRLDQRGLVEIGAFLLQSPTNRNRYDRLPSTAKVVVQERISLTAQVCQELGARTIALTHAEIDRLSEEMSTNASIGGGSPVAGLPLDLVSVDASRTNEAFRFDGLSIQTSWTFAGRTANVDAAANILRTSGVYDENLDRMIELFRSDNSPKSYSFEMSTENEIRQVVDWLADVGLPFVRLQADFDSFRRSHTVFRSHITAEFGAK